MSPRRMDISSLLRDPSPPHDDRHSLPASLLTILNTPHNRNHIDRGPFLGLDALVHVASEERRRIILQDGHDRHPHLDLPPSFHDNPRPHKRPRDTCPPSPPRSPSSAPTFPPVPGQSTSPSTRHHPSASPTITYPTLRPQPILHIDPSRSAPALLNDPRSIPHTPSLTLQHTSPFSHPPPLLAHSSPRNNSPHRHSPQLLRSHNHPSPVHSASPPSEPDAMSPRYGCGPRMAGGIDVLSSDPSPVRDPSRPEFSFYQSPKRDLSMERLLFESYPERARHDLKLSPLSARPFSLDDERHRALPPAQESVFPHERVRSRHSLFPSVDTAVDDPKIMPMFAKEPDFSPLERHPIRVWEEQPPTREAPRRVSPSRIPYGPAEASTRSAACESRFSERLDGATVPWQDVAANATRKGPPPPHHPTLVPLASDLHTPVEETDLDLQPALPIPAQPGSHAHPSLVSLLNSSTPPASASPVLELHPKNLAAQPEHPGMQLDTSPVPPTPSDPIVSESVSSNAKSMHVGEDVDSPPVQPSPEVQPVGPGTFEMSTRVDALQSTSRSPPQQPLLVPLPAKDEANLLLEDILVPMPIQPWPASCQSPDPVIEREPSVPEQVMMNVDEELLSLVEDRPARILPALNDSKSLPLITVSQAITSCVEQSGKAPASPSMTSSQPVLKGPLMMDEEKDRASMPPPAPRNKKAEKDKTAMTASTATGSKKKKDGTSKTTAKPKQPPKSRAKPAPKPKVKSNTVDPSLKTGIPKVAVNVNARSRSASVIPGAVEDVVPEAEVDESDKEDDKLYCVCKTRYDEDRMMIACDRCDEWFHTLCVNVLDLEIDLVDQFICPPCVQRHPHLRTTWKRRCLFGLQHEDPSSSEACHKPSRGAFSKYCTDDCGIKSVRGRIAQWEISGGVRDLLWQSVKNAVKREGVVVYAVTNGAIHSESKPLDSAAKRRAEREVTRLNARLEEVVRERELMKRELDMVMWREKVVELASERAGKVDDCGWDQRLCWGEEWADFGQEVLESYEEERVKVELGDDAMPLDSASATHGEWWCTGKKKCERHAGWQKLRAAEVSYDKETKEGILLKLTTREREIRKCIEDIIYPQPAGTLQVPPSEVQLNGPGKPCPTGHVSERKKKTS